MPEIISRKEARARGLKRYFTGKACKHGHVCERFVGGARCQQCEAIRNRNYYAKNPDRKKLYVAKRRKEFPQVYVNQLEANRRYHRTNYAVNGDAERTRHREYERKKADLISVLRAEMPELLKEFDL